MEQILASGLNCFLEFHLRLIHQKVMWKMHWTPLQFFKIHATKSDKCWRCDSAGTNLSHMLWECFYSYLFWVELNCKLFFSLSHKIESQTGHVILSLINAKGKLNHHEKNTNLLAQQSTNNC